MSSTVTPIEQLTALEDKDIERKEALFASFIIQ